MSSKIDNLIAAKILSMLIKPFPESDAYKLGIIDKQGKKLRDPKTEKEKDAYDYLSRLVFNLKKILNKLPGGDTKLKNLAAGLFLVKEQWRLNSNNDQISEIELRRIINLNFILAEETVQIQMFKEEGEGGGAITGQGQITSSTIPTNITGHNVSTDEPVIRKKKPPIVKRQSLDQVAINVNNKSL